MKPQTIGRVLGIGLRVAGRMAGQRMASGPNQVSSIGSPEASASKKRITIDADSGRIYGQSAGRATGNVARGVGGFLRPFTRVGNILFLEVVGAFFFLFVVLFATRAWGLRAEWANGPEHTRFLVYVAMTVLFLYLGVSSFWRARRK